MNKTNRYILIFISFFYGVHLDAQTPVSSLDGADVELIPSWINRKKDLNTNYLHRLDPDRLLHNFRVNAGIPSAAAPLEGWESPGCGLRGDCQENLYREQVSLLS